jgi:hypothetical protein
MLFRCKLFFPTEIIHAGGGRHPDRLRDGRALWRRKGRRVRAGSAAPLKTQMPGTWPGTMRRDRAISDVASLDLFD